MPIQPPWSKTNRGAQVNLDGSPKNESRYLISDCAIVVSAEDELRVDLFVDLVNERFGVGATHHEAPAQLAAKPRQTLSKTAQPGINLIAASGAASLTELYHAALPVNASPGTLCLFKWGTSQLHTRSAVMEMENFLSLTFRNSRFYPDGMLGWGFQKVVDPLDGGGDPVRMLTHLTRVLRHLHVADAKSEQAKAAMATVAHGSNATLIKAATDGQAFILELEFEGNSTLIEAGAKLAGWLERTEMAMPQSPWLGWIQNQRPGFLSAGIISGGVSAGTSHTFSGLIMDTSDPIIEAPTQTSYNVA